MPRGRWRGFSAEFREAIEAGERRDYKKAIGILESLAARGLADASAERAQDTLKFTFILPAPGTPKKGARRLSFMPKFTRVFALQMLPHGSFLTANP